MTLAVLYVSTLVVFLALDALMLSQFVGPYFERHVGVLLLENPRWIYAGVFYIFYIGGILWFASWPAMAEGGWRSAALNGALIGLLAFGCYESVNMATLKDWTWKVMIPDMAWGTAVTATSAAAGLAITQALGFGRV